MNSMHRILRKLVPFLYERNWYNGQFEFVPQRALMFLSAIVFCVVILIILWWMGKPVMYIQQ
jgi:hypothetical protein